MGVAEARPACIIVIALVDVEVVDADAVDADVVDADVVDEDVVDAGVVDADVVLLNGTGLLEAIAGGLPGAGGGTVGFL